MQVCDEDLVAGHSNYDVKSEGSRLSTSGGVHKRASERAFFFSGRCSVFRDFETSFLRGSLVLPPLEGPNTMPAVALQARPTSV